MTRFLLVCAGGAAGTGLRYLLLLGAARLFGTALPYGTLLVNLAGSFVIGIVAQAAPGAISEDSRLVLVTGILGGFTTYATFNQETIMMLRSGSPLLAAAYVAAMLAGCLLMGGAGVYLARYLQ